MLLAARAGRWNESCCTEKETEAPMGKWPAQTHIASPDWQLGLPLLSPGRDLFIPLFPNLSAFPVAMAARDQGSRELTIYQYFLGLCCSWQPCKPGILSPFYDYCPAWMASALLSYPRAPVSATKPCCCLAFVCTSTGFSHSNL